MSDSMLLLSLAHDGEFGSCRRGPIFGVQSDGKVLFLQWLLSLVREGFLRSLLAQEPFTVQTGTEAVSAFVASSSSFVSPDLVCVYGSPNLSFMSIVVPQSPLQPVATTYVFSSTRCSHPE